MTKTLQKTMKEHKQVSSRGAVFLAWNRKHIRALRHAGGAQHGVSWEAESVWRARYKSALCCETVSEFHRGAM
jgi:hypothetical protein